MPGGVWDYLNASSLIMTKGFFSNPQNRAQLLIISEE